GSLRNLSDEFRRLDEIVIRRLSNQRSKCPDHQISTEAVKFQEDIHSPADGDALAAAGGVTAVQYKYAAAGNRLGHHRTFILAPGDEQMRLRIAVNQFDLAGGPLAIAGDQIVGACSFHVDLGDIHHVPNTH